MAKRTGKRASFARVQWWRSKHIHRAAHTHKSASQADRINGPTRASHTLPGPLATSQDTESEPATQKSMTDTPSPLCQSDLRGNRHTDPPRRRTHTWALWRVGHIFVPACLHIIKTPACSPHLMASLTCTRHADIGPLPLCVCVCICPLSHTQSLRRHHGRRLQERDQEKDTTHTTRTQPSVSHTAKTPSHKRERETSERHTFRQTQQSSSPHPFPLPVSGPHRHTAPPAHGHSVYVTSAGTLTDSETTRNITSSLHIKTAASISLCLWGGGVRPFSLSPI
mmetsp:Transcript_22869/g.65406  ORF Transcript_22869/g.65406 Transcript_22869/m.65406 type:complete len:281 (+) Transcript_22869:41-883(+)